MTKHGTTERPNQPREAPENLSMLDQEVIDRVKRYVERLRVAANPPDPAVTDDLASLLAAFEALQGERDTLGHCVNAWETRALSAEALASQARGALERIATLPKADNNDIYNLGNRLNHSIEIAASALALPLGEQKQGLSSDGTDIAGTQTRSHGASEVAGGEG